MLGVLAQGVGFELPGFTLMLLLQRQRVIVCYLESSSSGLVRILWFCMYEELFLALLETGVSDHDP